MTDARKIEAAHPTPIFSEAELREILAKEYDRLEMRGHQAEIVDPNFSPRSVQAVLAAMTAIATRARADAIEQALGAMVHYPEERAGSDEDTSGFWAGVGAAHAAIRALAHSTPIAPKAGEE